MEASVRGQEAVFSPYNAPESFKTSDPNIPDLIRANALKNDLNPELPLAIVEAESQFKNICNSEGCEYGIGIFQIVQSTFDEQCEGDVYNEEDNINCGIKLLKQGDYWRWEQSKDKWFPKIATSTRDNISFLCSCMAGLNAWGLKIPGNARELTPNTSPAIGRVALFKYNEGKDVNDFHAALITGFTKNGFKIKETNFKKCRYTERFISWNDKFLRGFYEIPK